MKNKLISYFFYKEKLEILNNRKSLYTSNSLKNDDIIKYQIEEFNKMWNNAYLNIPFYKMWKEKYKLPDKIEVIGDLKKFPILTKTDIQKNKKLIFNHLKEYNTISTGGSSGEPTAFPTNKDESNFLYSNIYIGRSWWNIKPLDPTLLYWGHSHLFGSGIKGKINEFKRQISDFLINTKRFNAYDMSVNTLRKYYNKLSKENPIVIIGYTSTIYMLSKFIEEHNLILNNSNLKGIIVTSETVSDADIKLIEKVFSVPCIIEYGMAEAGVISYSKNKSNEMKVLWDAFIARTDKDNTLLITTIYNRLFPLINYRTDDIVDINIEIEESILEFSKIMGRKKDILKVEDNLNNVLELSGILMVHLLKSYPNIYEITFEQLKNHEILINYVSSVDIESSIIKEYFIKNISIDHKNINPDKFLFQNVKRINKTIAGKIKLVEEEK